MSATTPDITPPAARPLTRGDYKTLVLAALGGALEFYDFVIFVFFTGVLAQLFFPADMPDWLRQTQTFAIFAAGFLARPLGGIVMAHFGDLVGRKRMFTLSVLLMALPTLLMGLLPTYAQIGAFAPVALLVLRLLQGVAVGGEVPGAWVFVAEHVPARRTGYACGMLTAGLTAGILLGSLITGMLNRHFASAEITAYAWRIPFLIGGGFGLVAVYLRRWLHETPVFVEMQARRALAGELPLKLVLREHRRAVAVSLAVSWLLAATIVVVILMTPVLLQKQFHVAAAAALQANSIATACLALGCVCAGLLADRFDPRHGVGAGALLYGGAYWFMMHRLAAPDAPLALLHALYALTGFLVGTIGMVPLIIVRSFPPEVRFTGLSFSYNVAYAICGALTPVLVSLLMKAHPFAPALYVAAVCMLGALLVQLYRPARGG